MTQEVLKLALEALDDLAAWNDGEVGGHMDEPYSAEVARRTITAIKEALRENAMREVQRLGQEIEQEPVAYWKEHAQGLQRDYDSLLADFQAQRTWVGLTDEEENEYNYLGPDMHWVIQEIAAKLKEKNHG
jgi:hypothetical protein